MPYIEIDTEVWMEPEEFLNYLKDDELIEELRARGYNTIVLTKIRPANEPYVNKAVINLERLYEMKRMNSPAFDAAFSEYIWNNLGKVL
jgi:hypothetical protein